MGKLVGSGITKQTAGTIAVKNAIFTFFTYFLYKDVIELLMFYFICFRTHNVLAMQTFTQVNGLCYEVLNCASILKNFL